jgi:hypothetical protein
MKNACDARYERLNTGYLYIRVFSFYLGYIYRIKKYKKSEKYMRQSLFNLIFLVTANILIR